MNKILVADDNKEFGSAISEAYDIVGYGIDFAENGAVAVNMARECPYKLIIIDILMPIMDGITAIELIRELPSPNSSAIIYALTGYPSDAITAKCLEAGADMVKQKPYRLSDIRQWIQEAMINGRT